MLVWELIPEGIVFCKTDFVIKELKVLVKAMSSLSCLGGVILVKKRASCNT